MKRSDHVDLFKRYQSGEATRKEQAIVEDYILNNELNPLYLSEGELEEMTARLGNRVSKIPFGERPAVPLYKRWKVAVGAAAAAAAIVVGVYFFNASRHLEGSAATRDLLVNDIAPGKNGATITLANGKVIQLSDAKTGVVVGDALKYSDGSDVRYSSGSRSSGSLKGSQRSTGPVGVRSLTPSELQGADGKAQILTANTAKGQTYQFTLPDGTKVWLNADSKLEFPSSFVNGAARSVKLSGEGYFEVSKDKSHPFIVSTRNQDVTVLGTHFNISAYQDERLTTTTLVEGSVKVSAFDVALGRRNEILKPNQQSIQNPNGGMQVRNVDVSEALDWKNGLFIFNDEPLQNIMRRVARWYDVEVSYDGVDQNELYGGSVSRYDNVSKVLRKLELTGGIHFKIEGRRIKVMK